MPRLLVIVLLAFMSLQSVWAGMGSACGHESGQQASHFAHHAHEHQAPAADVPADDGGRPAFGQDGDCGACHMNFTQSLPAMHRFAGSPPLAHAGSLAPPARFSSADPRAIDRPQWLAPA
ncbi:hypothetical protein [Derxia gummosa]|uniref:Uncharacterized protein n=1 Tax=Derxia gummosa DSM 723 TaxID=1121388 RepID=A0A8B6X5C6_9BURK|nr:hypothetical protein [Derxia gummosa]